MDAVRISRLRHLPGHPVVKKIGPLFHVPHVPFAAKPLKLPDVTGTSEPCPAHVPRDGQDISLKGMSRGPICPAAGSTRAPRQPPASRPARTIHAPSTASKRARGGR